MKQGKRLIAGLSPLLLALAAGPATGAGMGERDSPRGLGQPVGDSALATQRGGQEGMTIDLDSVSNRITENALLAENVAEDVTTGDNRIFDGSFAGASGVTSAIQNSGNNVIIQDSTVVNVTMRP